MYLNAGELPGATTPEDDGALSVKDYSDTKDSNGNGYVDPEDLIARFRDGRDTDKNGYPDDISGWDAYHDQPDPATYDSAYLHSDRQMDRLAGEADNGIARVGTCPRCRLLIVKGGAEALDRTDDLAEAFRYAADAGASVIVSETADLGYSTLMRRTVEQLDREGVAMVISSNDFDSRDHQGGMFHPHAVPANGLVPDKYGTAAGESATRTSAPRPDPKHASANATARPPSARSCAVRIRPSKISERKSSPRRASWARSTAGGRPRSIP
jgi:hypothetical protein